MKAIRLLIDIWRSEVKTHEKISTRNMYINVVTRFLEEVPTEVTKAAWFSLSGILAALFGTVFGVLLHSLPNLFKTQYNPLFSYFFGFGFLGYWWIYGILYVLMLGLLWLRWQHFVYDHQSLLEGHKGTNRFTTPQEIEEQYKAIPKVPVVLKTKIVVDEYGQEREVPILIEDYPGLSGTIISRSEEKGVAYIDTGPSHNVIEGRTRSGKTQAKVKGDIDSYSRSEEKPHLLIASTKYELLSSSQDQLIARGYELNVLNLIELLKSIGYNNLDLVKEAYMRNDIGEAIELCKTFSYPLYHNKEAREPVWQETAMALVNAIILALCYEFIEKTYKPELVTMFSVGQMIVELGTDATQGMNILDRYFDSLDPSNPARTEYSTVRLSSGQMRSSIFTSTQAKLRNFTAPKVAALMSETTFKFDKFLVGYHKNITVLRPADNIFGDHPIKITISHLETREVLKDYTLLPGKKGFREDELTVKIINPKEHKFEISVRDNRIVTVTFNDGTTETYTIEKNKPQALFVCMPDYIETNSIIASTFIQQLYYVVSKHASKNGDKLERRLRMVLDEFANLDAFSNIMSMMSVGAGRGILLDLYIQDWTQLEVRYGEEIAKFIRSQAMNFFFIHSSNEESARAFSELLGNNEVVSKTRSGNLFQRKSVSETPEARPLMYPYELTVLKEGEMVIYRAGTRRDLKNNLIKPYPIHNDGDSRMVYEYEYLSGFFGNFKTEDELDLPMTPAFNYKKYSRTFANAILGVAPQEDVNAAATPQQVPGQSPLQKNKLEARRKQEMKDQLDSHPMAAHYGKHGYDPSEILETPEAFYNMFDIDNADVSDEKYERSFDYDEAFYDYFKTVPNYDFQFSSIFEKSGDSYLLESYLNHSSLVELVSICESHEPAMAFLNTIYQTYKGLNAND